LKKSISIHTSDRILFKRCRRKWDFISSLRQNLEPKDSFSSAAWFGTGIHFALEDYHGYNKFGHPAIAFENYYQCFDRQNELNMDCETLATLAPGMMTYYTDEWLPKRKKFQTYVVDGKPQVEVLVTLELKELSKKFKRPVYYSMRFDRVVQDEYGRLWIMDYKTVTKFDTGKLETDPQISAYSWGAEIYYNKPIEGMIYLQFKKALADEPRELKNGEISVDKSQSTTYYKYREMLKFKYGSLANISEKHQECLDYLLSYESDLGDNFIRYDMVRRNDYERKKEYDIIVAETLDMMNKKLSLYPNPTADCYWDCQFRPVCLSQNDGSDYMHILNNNYTKRKGEDEKWRNKIHYPQTSQQK
jgi:hypothetical protein